jgi:HK97 family phage portal protein
MGPIERIGSWLRPIAEQAGWVEKSHPIAEPVSETVRSSDDLYALIWGAGIFTDVHPILAYRLYLKSDVLGAAIHRIAHQIAGFTLGLTSDSQDFDPDAPVVRFLNESSEGYSKRRFLYEIATSYLLTNEAWVVLRGRVDREPTSRTWLYPFDIIDQRTDSDGLPSSFYTNADRDRRVYRRVERGGRIRYIDDRGMNELVPILGNEAIDRPFRGQSPVAHLLYSVQQNVEGKRHNTSLLKNGLRLTGGVMPTEDAKRFSTQAVRDIQTAFQAMRGSGTAGGTLVMPERVEKLDLAISNREMDYVELLREARDTVYAFYNIPLPLVSNDASTFNNFTTAQTAFYDGAVFPVFEDIADALGSALATRFPELQGQSISYNENTIKALRGRNLERMKRARETNALTTNEIREMAGYDPVDDGDDVLAPSTLVPVGGMSGMEFPETSPPTEPFEDEDEGATEGITEEGEGGEPE